MSIPIKTTDTYNPVDDDDDFGSLLDEDQPAEEEDDEEEEDEEHEYEDEEQDEDEDEEEEEEYEDEDEEDCSTGVCNTRMVAPIIYATPIPVYNPGTIHRPPASSAVQLVIDDDVARASPPRIPNVVHMQQVPTNALDAAQIPTFRPPTIGIPQPYSIPTMVRPGGLIAPVGVGTTRPPGVIPSYNAGIPQPIGVGVGIPRPVGINIPPSIKVGISIPTPITVGTPKPFSIPQPMAAPPQLLNGGIPQPIGGKPPSPFRIGIPIPMSQQPYIPAVQTVGGKPPSPFRIGIPVPTSQQPYIPAVQTVGVPVATPPMIRINASPPVINVNGVKPFSPPIIRMNAPPPATPGVQLPSGMAMPRINVPSMTPYVINVNQSKNFKELLIREAEETDAIFQFRSFVAQELATIPLSDIEGLEGKILSPDTIILASQLITKKKWFKISYPEGMDDVISTLISLSPGLSTYEIE